MCRIFHTAVTWVKPEYNGRVVGRCRILYSYYLCYR